MKQLKIYQVDTFADSVFQGNPADVCPLEHWLDVVVTAPGRRTDCVSRYFAPSYGIPEDPVTGSIHSALVPYWSNRLQKSKIHAYRASQRGGGLFCEYLGERVLIGGHAVKYLTGTINI